VRAEAAVVLARAGSEGAPAIPALDRAALDDSKLPVRLHATMALAEIGGHAAATVRTALHLLKDPDGRVRSAAARAFGCFGRDAESAVEELEATLGDPDLEAAAQAASSLGRIGAKTAVPALIRAFKHGEGDLPYTAADALAELAPRSKGVVSALTAALGKVDYEKRVHAARALARIGRPAAAAVPALVAALADDDPDAASLATPDLRAQVRLEAAVALALIDGRVDAALNVLLSSVPPPLGRRTGITRPDDPWSLRDDVLDALDRLGKSALPPLLARLENVEQDRAFAAWALAVLGAEAKSAGTALEKALNDADPFVRLVAASSSWRIGRQGALVVPVILDALANTRPAACQQAIDSRGNSDEPYRAALSLLLRGIGEPAVPFLVRALDAAAEAADPAFCRALAAIALDSEPTREAVRNGSLAWSTKVADAMKAIAEEARRDRLRHLVVGPQLPPDPQPACHRYLEEAIDQLLEAWCSKTRPVASDDHGRRPRDQPPPVYFSALAIVKKALASRG
ncbi:MAG TPA: HEAT repeat domain-containing protein, partial [Gemmataceae bacterium]|nr:HEAT repeat domain-containing protein [Gemmataceae bacterium]